MSTPFISHFLSQIQRQRLLLTRLGARTRRWRADQVETRAGAPAQQPQAGQHYPFVHPTLPRARPIALSPGPARTISSAGNRKTIITTDSLAESLEMYSCIPVRRRSSSSFFSAASELI